MKFYKLEARTAVLVQPDYPDTHRYAGKVMGDDVEYYIMKELEEMCIYCDEIDTLEITSYEVFKGAILFDCEFTGIVNFQCEVGNVEAILGDNLKQLTEL
jgi:hypothetical protein